MNLIYYVLCPNLPLVSIISLVHSTAYSTYGKTYSESRVLHRVPGSQKFSYKNSCQLGVVLHIVPPTYSPTTQEVEVGGVWGRPGQQSKTPSQKKYSSQKPRPIPLIPVSPPQKRKKYKLYSNYSNRKDFGLFRFLFYRVRVKYRTPLLLNCKQFHKMATPGRDERGFCFTL